MHRSSRPVLFAVLFFAGAVGCATTTPRDDASPPVDGAAAPDDAEPTPGPDTTPGDDDDDAIGAVTVTVTYPDGRQQTQRWGYAGGGNVNGVTNLAFKPDPTTLAPNVGIMLMRPVTQGRSFDVGAGGGGAPEGTATLMLDGQRGYQVATGTLQFSRVERLAPGALEVDCVLSGECASMTTPGDTVVVEVTFRGAIIAG